MAAGSRGNSAASSERLAPYQRKRDFARTPEPSGGPESPGERPDGGAARFVVQLHRARRLHYDLRFEIGGVLVSWAVPKGPTLDPGVKRAAVHVEDHPVDYLEFEGVIPAGQYGGGDVTVWDLGTWEPYGTADPAAAVAAGELHADVHGHKLRGRLVLVRRGHDRSGKDQWLLLHKRDEYAVAGWDPADYPARCSAGAPTRKSRPTRGGCGARTGRPRTLACRSTAPRRPARPVTSSPCWTVWGPAARGRSSAAGCG